MLQTRAPNETNQSENKQKTKIFSFSGTLNSLGTIDRLPEFRFCWNSNEEVFTILTSLEEHKNWVSSEVKIRPPNGSVLLYNRNNLRTRSYHNDKYFWKTRKNSKSSARVDHSSLRIRGIECIYCSYVHSALVPTFHRRCYWLLENPDIVLVHYLNIPDKSTTFDNLVTCLLAYKTLTEHELFSQLQPILTNGEEERNNNKAMQIDINKLIAAVKNYKEPKAKGRSSQKKTSGSNKKTAVSSTITKSSEAAPEGSQSLDKCTNCNRYYTTNCSTASTSSRTNVAVTINRQTSPTSHAKHSAPESTTTSQAASSSELPNAAQQNFLPVSSMPNVTFNQGILTAGITGHSHSNQMYPCHESLHGTPYSAALHNLPNTSSNGSHGYGSNPVTSEGNSCMLENDLVVLDYDGMNLVQSNQAAENDFAKAFIGESEISLFENDLLNYLPDYLSEFEPSLQNSIGIMPSDSFVTTAPSQIIKTTPYSTFTETALCQPATSAQFGLPSHPHSNETTVEVIPRGGRTMCSPTEMISTDCHTLNNLTPLLHSKATTDGLFPDSHQCPSKDVTLNGHLNMLAMGVPGVNVAEMDVPQMNVSQDDVPQVDASVFGVSPVSGVGLSDPGGAQESTSHFSQAVSMVEISHGSHEVISDVVARQINVSPGVSSTVGTIQLNESSKPVTSAQTIKPSSPNVCAPNVDPLAAGTTNHNGTQLSFSQAGMSHFHLSSAGVLGKNLHNVETTPPIISQPSARMPTKDTYQTSSRASTQSSSEATGHLRDNIITEFSPEWSYCDGRTKILILGDWSRQDGQYSCLFDGCSVPATLIQPGVLRCFCPPHEQGLVTLQVVSNGFIISNACVFEYKMRESATNHASDWLDTSEEDLKKLILERIERLETILGIGLTSVGDVETIENEVGSVEDRIVKICDVLLGQPGACQFSDTETGPKGLTLLHLAAGLGYTKLILFLQNYASAVEMRNVATGGKSSGDMTEKVEVDKQSVKWSPHVKDSFGCTPLMWACWRGHENAAMALLAWEPSTYSECDQSGRSAKAIAQELGHVGLVRQMEEFMCAEDMYSLVMQGSPQSPSSSCAYLSVSSNEPQSPMSRDSLTWERVEGVAEASPDFEMASLTSEERPNTLGKVLVEIRTLIQQAEEKARSPIHTPSNSAPFSLGFAGFPDLPSDEGTSDNLVPSESEFGPRTPHYDTLSIDSSPMRTPSSHSPGSPGMRNSPQSTGTDTSEFEEFLSKPRQFLERDFSELTLTDVEQQELLQAAKIIQNAYRQFKIRKKQHIDELKAAVLIQSYYRRYKQFALYKRITKAAVLIQNSYRAHKEHEQFKRSRHAAAVIQTYFRHYRKRKQRHAEEDAPGKRLGAKYRKSSSDK